jgi:hypothetical protein
MATKLENQSQSPSDPPNANLCGFNFEQWAREVRPQLLASLQKRGR